MVQNVQTQPQLPIYCPPYPHMYFDQHDNIIHIRPENAWWYGTTVNSLSFYTEGNIQIKFDFFTRNFVVQLNTTLSTIPIVMLFRFFRGNQILCGSAEAKYLDFPMGIPVDNYFNPNFTWVDTPPRGFHTYRVELAVGPTFGNRFNPSELASISSRVSTRCLTASLYEIPCVVPIP